MEYPSNIFRSLLSWPWTANNSVWRIHQKAHNRSLKGRTNSSLRFSEKWDNHVVRTAAAANNIAVDNVYIEADFITNHASNVTYTCISPRRYLTESKTLSNQSYFPGCSGYILIIIKSKVELQYSSIQVISLSCKPTGVKKTI